MWTERPLGALANVVSGGTPSRDVPQFWGGDIPWVTPTDITACRTSRLTSTAEGLTPLGLASSAAAVVPAGSLLLTSRASVGECRIAAMPVCTNQGFKSLVPKDIDGGFLFYQVQRMRGSFERFAAGSTFLEIGKRDTERIGIPHPTRREDQHRIAAILTSLDTAIEKTETLIAKHQQIKAGLMHDLFTRGLLPDGTARPKPSVRPELYRETSVGVLPADWEVATLHSLLAPVANNMRSGPFGSALLKDELVEAGIPFLGIDNIHPEEFRTDFKRFVSPRKFQQLSRYGVRPGDVVITIMGTVGRSCVVPESLKLSMSSKHLWTMTFDQTRVLPDLVCWQLNHAEWVKSWFRRATQGGIMDAIQSSTLKGLSLPVPPILEQQLIAARYRGIQLNLASLRDRLVKARLQKQALMQVLLTGPHKPTPSALTTETA